MQLNDERILTEPADARDAPPLDPIFFIFMQFLEIMGQNNRLPLGLEPPLENSASARVTN